MSGPLPAPEFAQIPLPPGMTLEDYMTLQGQLVTIAITIAVATGIMLWDYFVLFRDEIAVYHNESGNLWQTPGTWFFVILRYAGIVAMIPSLFFTSVQSAHCQVAVALSQFGVVMTVAASGAIFSFRVLALWNGNLIVRSVVSFMYCVMLACWIAVASRYEADQGPPTHLGSNCQMRPIVAWAPISFASSVVFDTVMLVLTLIKYHVNVSVTSSQIGRQIYTDNVMYFLITAVTNITVLAVESLDSKHSMIKPVAVPFSTLMTVTMGSRVYLNLKLIHTRNDRRGDGGVKSQPSIFGVAYHSRSRAFPVPPPNMVVDDFPQGAAVRPRPHQEDKSLFGTVKSSFSHESLA